LYGGKRKKKETKKKEDMYLHHERGEYLILFQAVGEKGRSRRAGGESAWRWQKRGIWPFIGNAAHSEKEKRSSGRRRTKEEPSKAVKWDKGMALVPADLEE